MTNEEELTRLRMRVTELEKEKEKEKSLIDKIVDEVKSAVQ